MKIIPHCYNYKRHLPYFFAVCCLIAGITGHGQTQSEFKVFFEKTYVHTDKDYYAAGEDIWFKAYLVNAQTGVRINTSSNLYVELISPDARVISQETLHLVNGLTNGDFILPNDAAAGSYRIRAYTNWMKNFGDLFLFEKKISVAANDTIKTIAPRPTPVMATAAVNTATVGVNHLYFFPEGGAMVAGLPVRMAFKAVDNMGKGISVKGVIVTAAGDSITPFETSHAGLGNFTFTPQPGTSYFASGKYYGKELFRERLPQPLAKGFVLSVNAEEKNFAVTVRADTATSNGLAGRAVSIIARHVGKACFTDSILLTGQPATLRIPKDSLQPGLNAITLYDENKRPQCERLVFVNTKTPVTVSLTTSQPGYHTRDTTIVHISITDGQNKPVGARLSLAATDAGLIEAGRQNMVTYLSLESEIRGEIENPMQYFDVTNPQRFRQLDLLLQTQGWREFLWRRLKDTSIVIKYLPEPGITLSGRVRRTLSNKGLSNMNITLFAGNSSGDKIFFTKTNAEGRYFLDGLPLVGWQTVKLTTRNEKDKKEGMILLDSVLPKTYPVKPTPNIVYDTSVVTGNFWRTAISRNRLMEEQVKNAESDLGNVTVRADPIKQEQLQERGMKYGRADSLFIIQPADKEYETLARFIVQRYPGAYTDANSDGFFFYGDRGTKTLPRWIVDGQEERFSTGSPLSVDPETGGNEGAFERVDFYNIPIDKVKKVYVQPVLSRTGTMMYVIHLSLLPGAFEAGDLSQIVTLVNGYYDARWYYVPDFSSASGNFTKTDLRSTIFWAPTIKTDENGKATVSFKNSDAKTSISVNLQGITDKGEPVAATLKYEVR